MHPKTLLEPHTIESSGVDWLTCTLSREWSEKGLRTLGNRILEEEADAGNVVSVWSSKGYEGWNAGAVRFGARADSYMLQLSSHRARSDYRDALNSATNVSRLDVQTTVRFETPQPYIIKTLHQDAISHRARNGRPSARTLITSTLTGDSLYIGRRISEIYMRAYDKGMEEHSEECGSLIRYEVEMKGKRARQLAASLRATDDGSVLSNGVISKLFGRESVRVPSGSAEWQLDSLSLPHTDATRKLLWARRSVAPTVRFLLQHFDRETILDALGLSDVERT